MSGLVSLARLSGRVRVSRAEISVSERRPRVTVVIPCYNYEVFLRDSVQSALDQEGVDVDLIVVDDQSTDTSLQVARSYSERDDRVTVVAHSINRGPVETFNDGLALATGEYVVRLDADDILTPGSLLRAVSLMERFPSVGLVYGHPIHFEDEPPTDVVTDVHGWTVWPGVWWLEQRCRSGLNCITSPEVVMRRSAVELVGGQVDLAQTHDMEMWMRLSAVCDVGHVEGADQAWHRDHASSRSALMVDHLTDLSEREGAFALLFDGIAGELSEAPRLRAMANRAVAADALTQASHAYDRGRADPEFIAALIARARSIYPEVEQLRPWPGLRLRQRLGPGIVHRLPPFVAIALSRRLKKQLAYRRWTKTGL
jgi:glycosyltransferase involved in cell wall biosynthesis